MPPKRPTVPTSEPAIPPPTPSEGSHWHHANGGQKLGPFPDTQFRQMASAGLVQPDDLVWREGMASWAAASTVEGLLPKKSSEPPPPSAEPPLPPSVPEVSIRSSPPPDSTEAAARSGPDGSPSAEPLRPVVVLLAVIGVSVFAGLLRPNSFLLFGPLAAAVGVWAAHTDRTGWLMKGIGLSAPAAALLLLPVLLMSSREFGETAVRCVLLTWGLAAAAAAKIAEAARGGGRFPTWMTGMAAIVAVAGVGTILWLASLNAPPRQTKAEPQTREWEAVRAELQKEIDERQRLVRTGKYSAANDYLTRLAPTRSTVWKEAAENGMPEGMYLLGEFYKGGFGLAKDDGEAVKWFRKAAEKGYAPAQGQLGMMFNEGRGVPKNQKEAVWWCRKAAEQGLADAQFNLGWIYMRDDGPQDYEEAAKWVRKAAEQGCVGAQTILGMMYDEGKGVPKDDSEAANWYRKAAEQGDFRALNNLNVMYETGRARRSPSAP